MATVDDVVKEPLGGSINDSFGYKLVAPGVQPAVGTFNFSIVLQVELSLSYDARSQIFVS